MAETHGPYPGLVHKFGEKLCAFEHLPAGSSPASDTNLIIFISGLGDTLLSVQYPAAIARALPPTWRIAQVLLSSSGLGFGTSSLTQDAVEMAAGVRFFRAQRGAAAKMVLLGHSTGCQDVMEYLTGAGSADRPAVDGAILQAPVSDREALLAALGPEVFAATVARARDMAAQGNAQGILPLSAAENVFGAPTTAARWLSLTSPDHDGLDDKFSSDLSDAQLMQTFGSVPAATPLCILFSGADEFVAKHVDGQALVQRWIGIVKRGRGVVDEIHSGLVDDATHNLNNAPDAAVADLVRRVVGFVKGL